MIGIKIEDVIPASVVGIFLIANIIATDCVI